MDDDYICGQGINMWREATIDIGGSIIHTDPPSIMQMRLLPDYGDGDPGTWAMRLRFAYWTQVPVGAMSRTFTINVLDQSGTQLINTRQAIYCDSAFLGLDPNCDPAVPGAPEWRLFDDILLVRDYAILNFEVTIMDAVLPFAPGPWGFIISSLWADRHSYPFPPDLCSYPVMTPTPQPTWTPWPTWTTTPTGTLTSTATPYPTAVGPTGTPTMTPHPFTTWTPSPSPTAWQSPMATLSSWQITPDASCTPFPSPTTLGALPSVTWPPIPTVHTVTAFPTIIPDESTITPGPTSTAINYEVAPDTVYTLTNQLGSNIDFTQIYSAGYDISQGIGTPFRVLRGTVRQYIPALAPLIDAIILMIFVIGAVYGVKILLAVSGAIIKIIEVIMEFIPL